MFGIEVKGLGQLIDLSVCVSVYVHLHTNAPPKWLMDMKALSLNIDLSQNIAEQNKHFFKAKKDCISYLLLRNKRPQM